MSVNILTEQESPDSGNSESGGLPFAPKGKQMEPGTRQSITEATARLRGEEYAKIERQDLKPTLRTAMLIMDLLQNHAGTGEVLTAPWIAGEVKLDPEHVRQTIRALRDGGLEVEIVKGRGLKVLKPPYPWKSQP